jgi:outer membrane protein OmpA-like peptidoglycan-associated protein
MKTKERKPLVAAVVVTLVGQMLPGCAVDPATGKLKYAGLSTADPCSNSSAVVGGLIGAGVGVGLAVLTSKLDHGKLGVPAKAAMVVGGAAVGAAIGHEVDHRRCEYAQLQKKYNLDIQVASITAPSPNRVMVSPPVSATTAYASSRQQQTQSAAPTVGLSVSIRDNGEQFASGSDELTPKAREYFWEIAKQYSARDRTATLNENPNATAEDRQAVDSLRNKRVLLIGHTDDTGDSRLNADLSERRALAVARVFAQQGIPDAQIYYQGAGETLPIADNRTEAGRARNRRVEIVDLADDQGFKQYLVSRAPDIRYFRPAPSVTSAPAAPTNAPSPSPTVIAKQTIPAPPLGSPTLAPNGVGSLDVVFDFGGSPSGAQGVAAQFGRPLQERTFSIFSTAYAAENSLVSACNADRPRVANGVKSLRDEKTISITEYLPGLYGTSWQATLNGNLVGLRNVAVFRDGGSPARRPDVLVYRDYRPGNSARPDFVATSEVNTYRGDRALLYRVFVRGPIQCMDIVFPYDNSGAAYDSNFYYERGGRLLVVPFKPRISRY